MTASDPTHTLVARAQQGDQGALDRLLRESRDQVEYYAHLRLSERLRQVTQVEDVVQETELRACRSIASFRWQGTSSFLRWLKGIAEHVILETASRSERRATGPLAGDCPDDHPSQGTLLRRDERFERLQEAFDALSPDYRRVILLARLEREPLAAVAERMGKSSAAVRQLLWRALKQLRAGFGTTDSLHLPDRPLQEGGSHEE